MFHNWIGEDNRDHCLGCGVDTVDFGKGVISDHGPLPLGCPGTDVQERHSFVRVSKVTEELGCVRCGVVLDDESLPDEFDWECDPTEDYPAVDEVDWQGDIEVSGKWISVTCRGRDDENREVWDVEVSGFDAGPLRSGVGGELSSAQALVATLSYFAAWAEAREYVNRGFHSDNVDMFDDYLADWADEVGSDLFANLADDLEYAEL
jgi:hypothetical protein